MNSVESMPVLISFEITQNEQMFIFKACRAVHKSEIHFHFLGHFAFFHFSSSLFIFIKLIFRLGQKLERADHEPLYLARNYSKKSKTFLLDLL